MITTVLFEYYFLQLRHLVCICYFCFFCFFRAIIWEFFLVLIWEFRWTSYLTSLIKCFVHLRIGKRSAFRKQLMFCACQRKNEIPNPANTCVSIDTNYQCWNKKWRYKWKQCMKWKCNGNMQCFLSTVNSRNKNFKSIIKKEYNWKNFYSNQLLHWKENIWTISVTVTCVARAYCTWARYTKNV